VARTRTRTIENNDAEQKPGLISRLRRSEEDYEDEADNGLTSPKDRPTPSARDLKPRGAGSTGLVSRIPVISRIVAYFRGVAMEMQKVTWPSREEATRLTSVVLGVTIAFAVGLGLLDVFLGWWFRKAFHVDSEWIFLAIAAAVTVLVSGTYVVFRNRI
jgi:preprotein translocase subunit SecE